MATTTAAPEVANPKLASDTNSTAPPPKEDASVTHPSVGDAESKDKPDDAPVIAKDEDVGGAATDVQKKIKRAERFGMPVQLSELEKRNSRAERFGTRTAAATNGADASDPSEDLKRKARAERFGIVKSESSDEDARKKARLARFGSSKPDPAEEEKKKARALRFSQPVSGSKANGKETNDEKTDLTAKAGGET